MKVEVDVISKEIVKPSSPTPDHLRHYTLSFLDQITVDVYNPMVYFYASDHQPNFNLHEVSAKLKTSLSELLTQYYPLAGRADNEKLYVDCNDEGVPFIEAQANCKISDLIQSSNPFNLNRLVPFELDSLNEYPMGVQLNVFECGGIGVGVCISHKIGDALSFFTVVNSWAAIAAGEPNAVRGHFRSAELFPKQSMAVENTKEGIVRDRAAKRFLIEAAKVEKLRAKYAEGSVFENERRPSRVEALSAFFYGRMLAAGGDTSSTDKLYLVTHTVNIRPRLEPPVPEYAFGNYYRTTAVFPYAETLKDEHCRRLVMDVRENVRKIDNEFLKTFQESEGQVGFLTMRASFSACQKQIVYCSFTSLCRLPVYEADFGWGKPVWVGSPALTFKNLVVFVDEKNGNGVEAYVYLEKEEFMAKLEADKEFLKYASSVAC